MSTLEFYTIDTINECLEEAGCKKEKQELMTLISDYFKRVQADPGFTAFMKTLKRNDSSEDPDTSSLAIDNITLYMKYNINKSPVITQWNKFISQFKDDEVSQILKIKNLKECRSVLSKPHLTNDEYYEYISEKLLYAAVLNFILYSCFKLGVASTDRIVNAALPNMANPEISRNRAQSIAKNHVEGIITILFKSYYDESFSKVNKGIDSKRKKHIYTFTLLAVIYKNSCITDKKYKSELNNYINTVLESRPKCEVLDILESIKERLSSQAKFWDSLINTMPEFNKSPCTTTDLIPQWANPVQFETLYKNKKYFITGHMIASDDYSLNKTYSGISNDNFPLRKVSNDNFPLRKEGEIQQKSITMAAKRFFSEGIILLATAGELIKKPIFPDKSLDKAAYEYLHKVFVEEIYQQFNTQKLGEI